MTVTVTMPELDVLTQEKSDEEEIPAQRRATALGTSDPYCHIITGSATLCGKSLLEPFLINAHEAGPAPWCPNGHPSCPECVQLMEE